MGREIALTALFPWLHGDRVSEADIRYTSDWIQGILYEYDQGDPRAVIEGRLVLGYGAAHRWILRAAGEAEARGEPVVMTDDEDIFAPPGKLVQAVCQYWSEWHTEDNRWLWKKQTITDFFDFYEYAIIYISVY